MTEDPKLSQRYRDLPREEPPAHLDAAIRAAARRAAETRPAPLVVPSGRRRWYFPLAAAAIIVLAVAVTVHVERERPDPELAVATAPEAAKEPAAEPLLRSERAADAAKPSSPREDEQRDARAASQAVPKPAPAAPPPAEEAARERALAERQAAAAPAKAAGRTPEQWLQGIVDLRRQGRHEEADKELAEFRKRHPDYRIAPELLEKVERRQ